MWRLVPEIHCRDACREVTDCNLGIVRTRLRRVDLSDFGKRSLPVEKLDQTPAFGRKNKHGSHTRHKRPHDWSAVFDMFAEHDIGMYSRGTLADEPRWQFWQRNVESLGDIHRGMVKFTLTFIPGRRSIREFSTCTITSNVLLAGSMTGLTSTILAL